MLLFILLLIWRNIYSFSSLRRVRCFSSRRFSCACVKKRERGKTCSPLLTSGVVLLIPSHAGRGRQRKYKINSCFLQIPLWFCCTLFLFSITTATTIITKAALAKCALCFLPFAAPPQSRCVVFCCFFLLLWLPLCCCCSCCSSCCAAKM